MKAHDVSTLTEGAADVRLDAGDVYDLITLQIAKVEVLISAIQNADDQPDCRTLADLLQEQLRPIEEHARTLLQMARVDDR